VICVLENSDTLGAWSETLLSRSFGYTTAFFSHKSRVAGEISIIYSFASFLPFQHLLHVSSSSVVRIKGSPYVFSRIHYTLVFRHRTF